MGVPCNTGGAGAGATRIAYTNGAVSISCAPATFYTLMVQVSGTYSVSETYSYSCGALNLSTCFATRSTYSPNYATLSSGGSCSAPNTCTFSIAGGTQVNVSGRGVVSGGSPFTMTADKTITVS